MSEELRYPPTPGQIMGDEPAMLPPPYEEAIKPGASQARGKPERPAPPYTPHKPSSTYPDGGYPPSTYPDSGYPPSTYPDGGYPPGSMYPPPQGTMYAPPGGPVYAPTRTHHYDQDRSISLAPAIHSRQHTQEVQATLVAGQCHKFEMWLSSKTGMRLCLVTLIMSVILAIVSAIVGFSFLTALFVVSGLCALAMLAWSVSLQRQRNKMMSAEERRNNVNRVEIRETGGPTQGTAAHCTTRVVLL